MSEAASLDIDEVARKMGEELRKVSVVRARMNAARRGGQFRTGRVLMEDLRGAKRNYVELKKQLKEYLDSLEDDQEGSEYVY